MIKEYIKSNQLDIDKIVRNYTKYIEKVIFNMSNTINESDKEEIVLDVFFILWKNQKELDYNKQLSSYIAGITRNVAKDYFKKAKIHYNISDFENSLYYDNKDFELLENLEEIKKVNNKLNMMKAIDIKIFEDFYYTSKSIEDIAKELNISKYNVSTRLYRIKRKLRKD
jgi:RNA polymerase sigma factor (sigma-70 family)